MYPCGSENRNAGKHPRIAGWQNAATTDTEKIAAWTAQFPGCNWGMPTGPISGVDALDVDPRNGGEESLETLEGKLGKLPDTPISLTGGGGMHFLFAHPLGLSVKSLANALGPGLDVKGDGGYIVVPPSVHASGRPYAWNLEAHPDYFPLAQWPEAVLRLVYVKPREEAKPVTEAPASRVIANPADSNRSRHDALWDRAVRWANLGLGEVEVRTFVYGLAKDWGLDFNERGNELENIVIGAMKRAKPEVVKPEGDAFVWGQLDLRTAIGSKPKPLAWLAKGIVAKGEAVVLTGSTGLGKTYITLQIVLDMCVGREVLGIYECKRPMKCLWIDEEMGIEMLSDRLTRQTVGAGFGPSEMNLLFANLDVRYQQGINLADPDQHAAYDKVLRDGQFDLVVMDSMVAIYTGEENSGEQQRAFYSRYIAPYKGALGTAFWILAHPPKPAMHAPAGAQHDPRGSGDKINAIDRSFYLEPESETMTDGQHTVKVILNRKKQRQGGSVTGQLIVIDGTEAQPIRVLSLGGMGGERAAMEISKVNACAQDMLVKLRGAPERKMYQPTLKAEIMALGCYDYRNNYQVARNMLVDQRIIRVLSAEKGRGQYLEMVVKDED